MDLLRQIITLMKKKKKAGLSLVAICLCLSALAQQKLNLGFEEKSIEANRPWGWSFDGNGTIALDSTIVHDGKYSVRIVPDDVKKAAELQELTFGIEPYQLKGKSIEIEGWIKADSFKGVTGFTITYSVGTDDGIPSGNISRSKIINETAGWQLLYARMKIPDTAKSIQINLQCSGNGVVWFDGFALKVKGKTLEQVEVTRPFSRRQLYWLHRSSYPIHTVDAAEPDSNAADEDLSAFQNLVGDAKIIALGESTHGSSEFFRLKHRLLEYSVKKLGVRVFALEDHQLIVENVNKYVLGGAGTARSCMYGLFSVWQNEEVFNMIKWARNYNDQHPDDKVEFVGFDIQNINPPMDSLLAFVKRQSPAMLNGIHTALDDLKKNGANFFIATDSAKLNWFNNATKVYQQVAAYQGEWLGNAKNKKDSMGIYLGIQYAMLVKQFAENAYRGHLSLYRDVAMADNISWLLSMRKPGTRMVVWAHDYHISRGDHVNKDMNIYNGISMGSHLSKRYGSSYKAFSLATYEGDYRGQISYSDFKMVRCPLYKSPRGTMDEALHQIVVKENIVGLLLDLSKARTLNWLTLPRPTRFANHVNIEYGYWTRYSIPFQFDGIFFIDKTSSARTYGIKD